MLIREVKYEPILCRLGWHRWRCCVSFESGFRRLVAQVQELLRKDCGAYRVHVHVCARCGRLCLRGNGSSVSPLDAPHG